MKRQAEAILAGSCKTIAKSFNLLCDWKILKQGRDDLNFKRILSCGEEMEEAKVEAETGSRTGRWEVIRFNK